ncbi:MAG TPA: M15 family metallopeptidase [Nevskiaceae bacterium]
METAIKAYRARIRTALESIGADPEIVTARHLPIHPEARRLTLLGLGADGRDKFATAATIRAWFALRTAAQSEGVELLVHSAFRSFDYQLALIRMKLSRGRSLEDVLSVNAPPGCSEHHSGRALDLGCPGMPPLEEAFETTDAFAWLQARAHRFGFRMSFPRGNRFGFLYEPWHWYYAGTRSGEGENRRRAGAG